MQMRKYWEVLVVDDERDVHAVSKLVLQDMTIYGVPLNVRTAASAAEAKQLLSETNTDIVSDLPLALIDVVMETDTAGLDLCRYIREDLQNTATQLIVRTGQAGRAPERSIIDRYDISTYITKVEATENRLYTLAKSGVRQYLLLRISQGLRALTNAAIATFVESGRSEKALVEALPKFLRRVVTKPDGSPLAAVEGHMAFFIGDHCVGIGDYADADRAAKRRRELRDRPATATYPNREEVRRYDDDVLLSLPGEKPLELIARTNMTDIPDLIFPTPLLGWLTSIQYLLRIAVRP